VALMPCKLAVDCKKKKGSLSRLNRVNILIKNEVKMEKKERTITCILEEKKNRVNFLFMPKKIKSCPNFLFQ